MVEVSCGNRTLVVGVGHRNTTYNEKIQSIYLRDTIRKCTCHRVEFESIECFKLDVFSLHPRKRIENNGKINVTDDQSTMSFYRFVQISIANLFQRNKKRL